MSKFLLVVGSFLVAEASKMIKAHTGLGDPRVCDLSPTIAYEDVIEKFCEDGNLKVEVAEIEEFVRSFCQEAHKFPENYEDSDFFSHFLSDACKRCTPDGSICLTGEDTPDLEPFHNFGDFCLGNCEPPF